jgi:gas vesicle protein
VFHNKNKFMTTTSKVLIAIGVSAAIGAALGILFAPEEGTETRKKIARRSRRLAGVVSSSIDEGKESLEEIKGILQKQLLKVNDRIASLS